MGAKQSTDKDLCPPLADWGSPNDTKDQVERKPTDLIFDAWAFCKAKPSLTLPTGKEEEKRQKQMAWRDRPEFIELNCGDDSFFVSDEKTVMAIADGVGGWRKKGVDPSLFANALMGNGKLFADTHRDETDPEVIVQAAYGKLLKDDVVKQGSSTVCAAGLLNTKDGKTFLDVLNLGDSGALVMRHGEVFFEAEETTHRFNFPKQLTVMPNMHLNIGKLDNVASASRSLTHVQRGDVVIMGTDGLFDNRFQTNLKDSLEQVNCSAIAVKKFFGLFGGDADPNAPLKCKVGRADIPELVKKEVESAYASSLNRADNTPWSIACEQATGEPSRGGKPDDITIMVARIVSRQDLDAKKFPSTAE